jgi:hypothetical protein
MKPLLRRMAQVWLRLAEEQETSVAQPGKATLLQHYRIHRSKEWRITPSYRFGAMFPDTHSAE